jgi:hypothetical protein
MRTGRGNACHLKAILMPSPLETFPSDPWPSHTMFQIDCGLGATPLSCPCCMDRKLCVEFQVSFCQSEGLSWDKRAPSPARQVTRSPSMHARSSCDRCPWFPRLSKLPCPDIQGQDPHPHSPDSSNGFEALDSLH